MMHTIEMSGMHEKTLILMLRDMVEQKKGGTNLKQIYACVNLATKKFHDVWSSWWEDRIPPRLEVDLIPVFRTQDGALMAGIEVEFFKEKKKNPYIGVEQAMSFGLFGFDSIVLWHIFTPTLSNESIEGCVRSVKQLIEGFRIPISYLATKIFEDGTFEFFNPIFSSNRFEVIDFISHLEGSCVAIRNPLLSYSEVKRRRDVLKVILKVPA